MNQYNHKFSKNFSEISPEARAFLLDYQWPGNVRELRNAIERIILIESGTVLTSKHLHILGTPKENHTADFKPMAAENDLDYNKVAKGLIREAMKITRGNVSEAARLMNMPSHKLRYRIKKYGLLNQQLNWLYQTFEYSQSADTIISCLTYLYYTHNLYVAVGHPDPLPIFSQHIFDAV